MFYIVNFEVKNGKKTEKKSATVRADSEKHAIRKACRDLGLEYPISSNTIVKSVEEGIIEDKPNENSATA